MAVEAVEAQPVAETAPAGTTVDEALPAGDQSTEESQADATATDGEQQTDGADALDESIISQLAEEEELDLNDPSQRSLAERMARREMKLRQQAETDGQTGEEDLLTDFERSLGETEEEQTGNERTRTEEARYPAEETRREATSPSGQWPVIRDRGEQWKSWDDGYNAELQELGRIGQDIEAGRKPDLRNLSEIRAAQNRRVLVEQLPFLVQLMKQQIGESFKTQFGEIMPSLQEFSTASLTKRATEAALSDLESTKEFKGIRELTKPEQGTVKFRDPETGETQEFANTPLNRILARHPEILSIKRDHKDPSVAMRLTMTAIYRQAARIAQSQSVKPENAKRLFEAGKRTEQKKQQDRARQTLNAGPGATSRGGSNRDDFLASQIQGSKFHQLFK